ncbi:hypothetical protein [Cryobacterium sp. PAMC25264]|uniref:hypothetical protein n=1 Tax=Cryobacterium sp. PAMC25264 TaxID=2861288 RepID=UPI001C634E65|nr:hypothetical protein [Cryobacterium sp. PAMC25264]QYF72419.1 hypothetical protein KY500_11260 [Cryobacterium sp. PAMC25264]
MAGLTTGAEMFGELAAYPAVVLLCAVLPFAVSFVIDAVNLMLRRERSAVPALVTALVLSFVVAATGFLLLQLGLVGIGSDAAVLARLASVGVGLLLVCSPLALVAAVARLFISLLRARALDRRSADGEGSLPEAKPGSAPGTLPGALPSLAGTLPGALTSPQPSRRGTTMLARFADHVA